MTRIQELEKTATQVRRDIIRMVHKVSSGHPGGSLGCTDFMTALYFEIMDHNPKAFNMDGKNEDVFFLSNGHISPLFYSVLARNGYFSVSELDSFRMIGSRLQGHPTPAEGLEGVRVASGSLGQGISVAIGTALSKKMNQDDKMVYVLTGDGELQEGQNWEALMFAAAKKVDNIIVTVDYNKQQIDGSTDEVLYLGDLKAKFEAFGWTTIEMMGNNMTDVLEKMKVAKTLTGKQKPVAILMHTEMGYGVDFMVGTNKWHGMAPNDEQTKIALAQLEETLGDY
ncbi:MAG: transketolase [Bacteroidales bacterium]|nr:transketolase [Bacteroidales bacterium]MDY0217111.1 transketolase [Bacteroidales bacterium]